MDLITIFKDLGFPVAVCAVLFYIIHRAIIAVIEITKENLIPCIAQYSKALESQTKALVKIDQTLDRNNLILVKLAEQLDCDDIVKELLEAKRNKEEIKI